MTDSFEALAAAARKVIARCPWTTVRTVDEYVEYIRSEADELLAAVSKGDRENVKEEMGDLLFTVVVCMLLAERSGSFPAREVMDGVVAKMRRRKPFVFDGTQVTVEEAKRLWAEEKAREKRSR